VGGPNIVKKVIPQLTGYVVQEIILRIKNKWKLPVHPRPQEPYPNKTLKNLKITAHAFRVLFLFISSFSYLSATQQATVDSSYHMSHIGGTCNMPLTEVRDFGGQSGNQ
jgi:hypothetical protein